MRTYQPESHADWFTRLTNHQRARIHNTLAVAVQRTKRRQRAAAADAVTDTPEEQRTIARLVGSTLSQGYFNAE